MRVYIAESSLSWPRVTSGERRVQHRITMVKPHGPSRDPIVIATRGNRNRRRAAPAFITDTNLILRFIIESMTIIVRTSIP